MYRHNPYFFWPYMCCLLLASIWMVLYQKGDMVLWFNERHTSFDDLFFTVLTWLGSGWSYVALIGLLALIRFRHALSGAAIFLTATLLVHALKRSLNMPRPKAVFGGTEEFHMVDGITVHSALSFPSGHATTIFAMCCFLALLLRHQRAWGFILLAIAVMSSLSRVYLFQHFFVDVVFGSMLGMLCSTFLYWYFYQSPVLDRITWVDDSALTLLRKKRSA